MWRLPLLATLLLSLGGCSQPAAPDAPTTVPGSSLEGWIVDAQVQPVFEATITFLDQQVLSDGEGRFLIEGIEAPSVTLRIEAVGMQDASRTVLFEAPGQHRSIRIALNPLPLQAPYHEVAHVQGYIECSAFVAVGHDHGGGAPEGENPTDCGTYTTTQSRWQETVRPAAEGLVVEVAWTPNHDLAEFLLLLVYERLPNGTLSFLGFQEGRSPLKVHVPSADIAARFADGGVVEAVVEIGGDPNGEDVAAGVAVDQSFEGFTSVFYGKRPTHDYSTL